MSLGKQLRRKLVERLREEGRQAALAGKSRQSNPHKYEDAHQWSRGYESGLEEVEELKKGDQE